MKMLKRFLKLQKVILNLILNVFPYPPLHGLSSRLSSGLRHPSGCGAGNWARAVLRPCVPASLCLCVPGATPQAAKLEPET